MQKIRELLKHEPSYNRSSYFVSLPAITIMAAGGSVAAFFGFGYPAAVLIFFALLALTARLWAQSAGQKMKITLKNAPVSLFPGDTADMDLDITNDKLLPVLWCELFMPFSDDLCLVTDDAFAPDNWDEAALSQEGFSTEKCGAARIGAVLWYEERSIRLHWHAEHRGIYKLSGWKLRTGDGFGLAQMESPVSGARRIIAVYPKLLPVDPGMFLRNVNNCATGARGNMEDLTVIRSTREYMESDPAKRINWRLAARGLPVTVNVYEEILPRSAYFILDGDSFGGLSPHPEELEEALSILAGILTELAEHGIECGLSVPAGTKLGAQTHLCGCDIEDMLFSLAAYNCIPPARQENGEEKKPHLPEYDESFLTACESVGRFYYICRDYETAVSRHMLQLLEGAPLSILTYEPPAADAEDAVWLRGLREGGREQ